MAPSKVAGGYENSSRLLLTREGEIEYYLPRRCGLAREENADVSVVSRREPTFFYASCGYSAAQDLDN